MTEEQIIRKINDEMKNQGRTNKWLADAAGVSPDTMTRWRTLKTTVPLDYAESILKSLGYELEIEEKRI